MLGTSWRIAWRVLLPTIMLFSAVVFAAPVTIRYTAPIVQQAFQEKIDLSGVQTRTIGKIDLEKFLPHRKN